MRKRSFARLPRRRREDDLMGRESLNAPGHRTEHERLTWTSLVDHLFIELAHARATLAEEYAVQAAFGDCAATGDGDNARIVSFVKHKSASEMPKWLEFRRVLFR